MSDFQPLFCVHNARLARSVKQTIAESSEDEKVVAKQELDNGPPSLCSSDSEAEAKPAAKVVRPRKKAVKKEADGDEEEDEDVVTKLSTRDRKLTVHQCTLLDKETGLVGNRIINLEAEREYFRLHLTLEQSAAIVANTNDFGQNSDKAWARWVNIDHYDLDRYIGLCIYMGIRILPSIEDYWGDIFGCKSLFEEVMTHDRFEMIAAHLHVAAQGIDNSVDTLAKVRDVLNQLNTTCTELWPCAQNMVYDEMMVKCKSKYSRYRVSSCTSCRARTQSHSAPL
jgi:hypothetical protein